MASSIDGVVVRGLVAPGFGPVRDCFVSNFEQRGELGAAFAAVLDGELVVDLWGGASDAGSGSAWNEDTLCVIFSGSKGLVATCILQLIDRGLLELDAPVCRYWPEFAAQDKEEVLVRHVVSHQAGLPGIRQPVTEAEFADAKQMTALLAGQELFWPAGSRLWYHPITYGWLCGELVRRVTGEPLGRYLRREIAEPLGLEMWIGLPVELEDRVARCQLDEGWRGIAADGPTGDISLRDLHDVWHNPELFVKDLPWNTRGWHAGEIPGANGIASARAMATHYGVLAGGGRQGDTVLLSPEAISLGQTLIAEGLDPCDDEELRFGVGWALQNEAHEFGPPAQAFGHSGAGGSQHGAWPDQGVGFSYVMNLMRDDEADERATSLLDALYRCVESRERSPLG